MATISTPTPIEGPVLSSVDIDLDTPAPARRTRAGASRGGAGELWALGGGSTMNRSTNHRYASNFDQSAPLRMPGQLPELGPPNPGRPYIRPTPTFSFTDEIEAARLAQQRLAKSSRAGGGVLLLVLMLLAGSAGYVAVKYRVWQDTGPLVERGRELARSLRTLGPWASPEAPAPAPAAAPRPLRLQPEVVPITRGPEDAPRPTPRR
jgi:hypothetical protein